MSLTPIFSMGIGVYDGSDYLSYARSLFTESELNPVDGSNGLTTTLVDYLDTNKQDDEQSLINSDLGKFILTSCLAYLEDQGFDTDQHEYVITNAWLNEMVSGSNHRMHSHCGHIVSGCFYVDVPEGSQNITFDGFLNRFDQVALPIRNFTGFNSGSWTIPTSEGQFLCWNSYIRHGVPEQTFEGIRRSIAFDVSAIRKR